MSQYLQSRFVRFMLRLQKKCLLLNVQQIVTHILLRVRCFGCHRSYLHLPCLRFVVRLSKFDVRVLCFTVNRFYLIAQSWYHSPSHVHRLLVSSCLTPPNRPFIVCRTGIRFWGLWNCRSCPFSARFTFSVRVRCAHTPGWFFLQILMTVRSSCSRGWNSWICVIGRFVFLTSHGDPTNTQIILPPYNSSSEVLQSNCGPYAHTSLQVDHDPNPVLVSLPGVLQGRQNPRSPADIHIFETLLEMVTPVASDLIGLKSGNEGLTGVLDLKF